MESGHNSKLNMNQTRCLYSCYLYWISGSFVFAVQQWLANMAARYELLMRSYKILHKLPDVDGFYTYLKKKTPTVPSCQKALQAAFLMSLTARSNCVSVKSWHISRPMNASSLIFSILSSGNFSHKNDIAGPFLSSACSKFSPSPSLICRGGSNT